jgi:predicted NBD/HSP70 family sugar kinase
MESPRDGNTPGEPVPRAARLGRTKHVNTALIRKINVARVFHAIREHPGLSQGKLAAVTQVDRATVSNVVQQLEADGLVYRSKGTNNGRIGRPEDLLHIRPGAGLFLGLAVEADVIRFIAAGLDGVPRARLTVPSSTGIDHVVSQMRLGVRSILKECGLAPGPVRGVGLGLPALIDHQGHLIFAPNLKWTNLALLPELQGLIPTPVHVENDANAAALAEQRFGVCRGVSNFLLVHGHSGIGGGLYLEDDLYRGQGGFAGEIGHVKMVPNGRPCSCGGKGCLEAYASERAVSERLREQGREVKGISDLVDAALQGDKVTLKALREAGRHLGLALANVANTVDVRHIVLGGDLAALADYLLPSLQKVFFDNVLQAISADVEILVSALPKDAVALGGVALALEGFLPLPTGSRLAQLPSSDGQ